MSTPTLKSSIPLLQKATTTVHESTTPADMDKSADELATASQDLLKQQKNDADETYKDEATNMVNYEPKLAEDAKLPDDVLAEQHSVEDARARIQSAKDTIDVQQTTPARPTGLTDREKMDIVATELNDFSRRASQHGQRQLGADQEREQFQNFVRRNVDNLVAGVIAGDDAPLAKLNSYVAPDRECSVHPDFKVKEPGIFEAKHKEDVRFWFAELQRHLSAGQIHEVIGAICRRGTVSTHTQSKDATRGAEPGFDMRQTPNQTAAHNSTTTGHNNDRGGGRGGFQSRQGQGGRGSYQGRGGYRARGQPSPFNDHCIQHTDFNGNGKRPTAYGVGTTHANSKRRTQDRPHPMLPPAERRRRLVDGLCFNCSARGHMAKFCTN